jgi:hypothetical protein
MGQRDSVGAVAISIPVIVSMAGIMAAQSVEVRRGCSPPPEEVEHQSTMADTDARIDAYLDSILAADAPERFSASLAERAPSF